MGISNLSFRHATEGSNEESAFDFQAVVARLFKPQLPRFSSRNCEAFEPQLIERLMVGRLWIG
jgi:hypothetical protein